MFFKLSIKPSDSSVIIYFNMYEADLVKRENKYFKRTERRKRYLMLYGMFVSDPTLKSRFPEYMDTVKFSLKIFVLFITPLCLSRAHLWPGFNI